MGKLLGVKLKHGSFDLESGDYPITFVLHRLAKRACFVWRRLLGRTPDDHTRKSPRRRPLPLPCTIPYRISHRWQQGMHTVRGHICQLALASICPRCSSPPMPQWLQRVAAARQQSIFLLRSPSRGYSELPSLERHAAISANEFREVRHPARS